MKSKAEARKNVVKLFDLQISTVKHNIIHSDVYTTNESLGNVSENECAQRGA